MMEDNFVVKALLKEGFFIKSSSHNSIKLENKNNIRFKMIDYGDGDKGLYSDFTKYVEFGDVSFLFISFRGYNKLLKNYEKTLKYLETWEILNN